jgi:hypothetical protein
MQKTNDRQQKDEEGKKRNRHEEQDRGVERQRGSYFSGLDRSVWTLGLATATLCPESMLQ